ncbi:MAG: lipid-transfer protein [Myxococcota bacterium]|nr:lipid-transfer protein [Myxococcota bacterium]MDP7073099.1 lipid-transfer protein [Myxococcota bacterium]MDP7299191.1 lipid-transfer protein [Myxococcota bacterium]MDP7434309.1 lipid-transfer protein [Myxococcota bacterium]MDP7570136.1 lipid-transfer protein [Myxococcota bacterium]
MSTQADALRDATAIVGVAETRFAKNLEASECQLASEAVVAALADAGIEPSEVDGLASYTMETTEEVEIARNFGAGDINFFAKVGYGGGGGPGVVGLLATAVATGRCRVGVAWRSRKRGSGQRPWAGTQVQVTPASAWTRPWGLLRPVDEIGMLTRRYMHEYGATRDHLANVAISIRKHANNNPRAIMYERKLTREDYMKARWISEPLCLFDNCLETDGALACVVVSAERSRDCPQRPVYIHSVSQGLPPQHQTMTNYWNEDPLRGPAWTCAEALYRASDIQAGDVKVAQLYDAFTPLIPLSLEGYGFCKRGEGAYFTDDGNLEVGGRLPVNTSGGGLSEAYVHGFNLINEGVRQMRGTSCNQVKDADTCLVTAGEGVPTSAMLLRN